MSLRHTSLLLLLLLGARLEASEFLPAEAGQRQTYTATVRRPWDPFSPNPAVPQTPSRFIPRKSENESKSGDTGAFGRRSR